jgi:uncharacterized protein YjfI (DUF2170 family)
MSRRLSSPSKNTLAQRAFRLRMRERGWVPHQIYILAQHKNVLDAVESALRTPQLPSSLIHLCQEHLTAMNQPWTTIALYQALLNHRETGGWSASVQGEGDSAALELIVPELGDLRIHLAAAGGQIATSAVLFKASDVENVAALNDAALRAGPHALLTSVGLTKIDGEDTYVAYGNLSSRSPLDMVVEELTTLAQNALSFVHLFSPHLSFHTGASS